MVFSFTNIFRRLLGISLVFIILASAVYSKDFDWASLLEAANAGVSKAQRILGEALLFGVGGIDQDKAPGLRLLEQSVTSGNVAAKVSLGKYPLSRYDSTYMATVLQGSTYMLKSSLLSAL